MFDKLDLMLIGAKNRLNCFMTKFWEQEEGSIMIELVVLIVVIIAIAALFRERLRTVVINIFNRLDTVVADEQN